MGKKKKLIKEVIEQFDFHKVRGVMEYLGWGWRGKGVPSVDEMKEEVERLCEAAYHGALNYQLTNTDYTGPYTCATGGFLVEAYITHEGKAKGFEVKFVVEEWSAFK